MENSKKDYVKNVLKQLSALLIEAHVDWCEAVVQLQDCSDKETRGLERRLRAQAETCSSLYAIFAQACDDFSFTDKRLLDTSCIDAFDGELDRLVKKKGSNGEVIKKLSEYRAKFIDFTLWN